MGKEQTQEKGNDGSPVEIERGVMPTLTKRQREVLEAIPFEWTKRKALDCDDNMPSRGKWRSNIINELIKKNYLEYRVLEEKGRHLHGTVGHVSKLAWCYELRRWA